MQLRKKLKIDFFSAIRKRLTSFSYRNSCFLLKFLIINFIYLNKIRNFPKIDKFLNSDVMNRDKWENLAS